MGPGRSGGLLFLAVLAFVLYLVLATVTGLLRVVLGAALVSAIVALAIDVARRR